MLDSMLPDMINFDALALQMGHTLTHYTTTGRDSATQSVLRREQDTRQIFTHTACSAFCRQFIDLKAKNELLRKLLTVFDKLNEGYTKST